MNKKQVGIFGLLAFVLTALVTPVIASAQVPDQDIHRSFYAPVAASYCHGYRHEEWRDRHTRERRHEDHRYNYHY